ncbi:PglL family O-oligosaccharyltransferase [Acinetobacter indicus]|uniref:PglL family O-oligosaccharyltransferase n=1 Tax=Acinetobacter indicus TaxID=756892 RepID=UPI003988BF02
MPYLLVVTLSPVFFILSILNPAFYPPWSSFLSEYLSFLALLCLLPILSKKNILIPKISLLVLLVCFIPIIQYFSGQIYYIDTAFLSFFYLFSFWLAVLIGFNSIQNFKNSLSCFFGVILFCGLISSLIALVQWLPIRIDSDFLMNTKGRPFANMAQPNHLSTFLILSVISCIYFFENKIINSKILLCFSIILLLSITLTQSRTAWVVFLFLSLYWLLSYKRDIWRLSNKVIILHLILFIIFSVSLPFIKEVLVKNPTTSILDRASSGHERVQIWQQAVEAIKLKPLSGYGWNQSSFAQFDTIQNGFIKHKLTSFHNIVLDILVWCGIPLGLLIIVFFSYLLIKFLINSSSSAQVCAISFVLTILVHALFEYPLSYSYFLLPMGFMFGFILYSFKSNVIQIQGFLFSFVFIFGVCLSFYIFREYSRIPDNMVAAEAHEMNERRDFIKLPYQKNMFTVFVKRAEWIALYPCTKLDKKEIDEFSYMVKTYMIHYDLLKFSKLLAYNGYIQQTKQYLNKINYMHNKKYTISDLQCSGEL